jgi:hypothetical protein
LLKAKKAIRAALDEDLLRLAIDVNFLLFSFLYLSRVPPSSALGRLFRVCESSCGNRLPCYRSLSPLEGSSVPRQAPRKGIRILSQSVISFCKGLATVTAGGGGAGRDGFWHPARKPASIAVAKIIPIPFTDNTPDRISYETHRDCRRRPWRVIHRAAA